MAPTDDVLSWPSVMFVQCLAAVGGLPHAAADAAEVERARLLRHAGHGDHAAAAERADVAPLQAANAALSNCGAAAWPVGRSRHGGGAGFALGARGRATHAADTKSPTATRDGLGGSQS